MKKYSSEFKQAVLLALEANRGDIPLTARETGVNRTTLKLWAEDENYLIKRLPGEQPNREIISFLEDLLWRLAASMPHKIEGASLAQVATAFGILFDKRQLLLGKPTSITADQTFRDAIARVMKEANCDSETARKALEIYVPAVKLLNE